MKTCIMIPADRTDWILAILSKYHSTSSHTVTIQSSDQLIFLFQCFYYQTVLSPQLLQFDIWRYRRGQMEVVEPKNALNAVVGCWLGQSCFNYSDLKVIALKPSTFCCVEAALIIDSSNETLSWNLSKSRTKSFHWKKYPSFPAYDFLNSRDAACVMV